MDREPPPGGGAAMTTLFWLKLYLLTVPVFFVIDMI